MVSSKKRKTMGKIFGEPISADIAFRDAVSLLESLGAEVSEGSGSRLRILINGTAHILHKPHGNKSDGSISKRDVKAIRKLITNSAQQAIIAEYLGIDK